MKIALGSDHRGDHAVTVLAEHLQKAGHDVAILGERGTDSRDYPDAAWLVGQSIVRGQSELGVVVCGSGNGIAIAANKIPGIRAGIAGDEETAALARQHNNANVLAIGADKISDEKLCAIVDSWLNAAFEAGRHARRVDKITAIEHGEDPMKVEA